jgi:hypothetical protein
MGMAIQTSFPVSRARRANALGVWVTTTRSEKLRPTDLRGWTTFLGYMTHFLGSNTSIEQANLWVNRQPTERGGIN